MPYVSMQEISLDDDFVRNDMPRLTDSLSDWFTEDSCCYTAKDAIKDLNDATTWSPSSPLKNAKQKSETPEFNYFPYHSGEADAQLHIVEYTPYSAKRGGRQNG
ncbi:unnamed protein product, partial [Mesorhabditis spiculigera]